MEVRRLSENRVGEGGEAEVAKEKVGDLSENSVRRRCPEPLPGQQCVGAILTVRRRTVSQLRWFASTNMVTVSY